MNPTDAARHKLGFLTLDQTVALAGRGIVLLDPHSTLITPNVSLGVGIVIWPNVTLQGREGGEIGIDSGTTLFSGTRIVAAAGSVTIGTEAEIGDEGGFT